MKGSSLVAGTRTNTAAVSSDGLDLRPTNNTVTTVVVFDVPPLITVQPVGQTVAPGGLTQLTVAAIGAAPLNFQWEQDGIDLPGANGPTLVFNPVSNANAGIYRVRVSNQVGNILSDPAALLVTGPPFLSTISDLVIDEDISTGAIPFTVLDFDTPAISVNVTAESSNPTLVPASGIALVGSGSVRSIRITPATNQSGTATISLTALDTTGASTTNRFLLTVRPVVDTIQIVTQPRSSVAATGSVASLTVTANSTLPLTYQWQFNGIDISGATATTFTITGVQRTNAGNFRVIISNADTTVTSATATLQVFDQLEGPTIVSVTRTGLSATVTFSTLAGPGYRLEYKNTFSDPAWTLVSSTTGTGNNVSIVDPDASVPTRFYRVRIE